MSRSTFSQGSPQGSQERGQMLSSDLIVFKTSVFLYADSLLKRRYRRNSTLLLAIFRLVVSWAIQLGFFTGPDS
jgi:hypothetical protein